MSSAASVRSAAALRTVLFRTGRHAAHQPRSAAEVPDAEARSASELRTALESLL